MSTGEHSYSMTLSNSNLTPIRNGSRIAKRKTARKSHGFTHFRFGGNRKDPLNLNGLIQKQMQSTQDSSTVNDDIDKNHGNDRPVEILLQPDIFDPLRLDPSSCNDGDLNSVYSIASTSIDSKMKVTSTARPSRTLQNMKRHRQNEVARYGNYRGYYGYRQPEHDQRLQYLQQDWFHNKQVLDIGCHTGHMTFYVAEHFQPREIVGFDIDQQLIQRARHRLTNRIQMANANGLNSVNDQVNGYPLNLRFQQGNFVFENDADLDHVIAEYDTIMAFSVTKWIHLNFGDQGLKRFFRRIYRALRPGGMFLLEPQPWSSYRLKRRMTKEIKDNYERIQFKPTQFVSYLLSSDIGFESCTTVATPDHTHKGFQRSIYLFIKPSTAEC